MRKKLFGAAITVAALLFWIGLWQLLAQKASLSLILPTPLQVARRLWELAGEKTYYVTLGRSFLRVFAGFGAGLILGFFLGAVSHFLRPVRALASPLMAILRATPVASFILVVLFWLETDHVPSFICLVMVLPIVWQNTLLGFESRSKELAEMAKIFHLSPIKTFLRIDLMQVASYVVSAGKVALGLAWKAGVAAEVLALPKVSVGYMIYNAKMYLETVDLYAWTVSIILFSILLEKLFVWILFGRRRWRDTTL